MAPWASIPTETVTSRLLAEVPHVESAGGPPARCLGNHGLRPRQGGLKLGSDTLYFHFQTTVNKNPPREILSGPTFLRGCATRFAQTVLARGVDAGLRLRRSRRDCLVISNGVRNLSQGKAEISLTGRNDKRRMKGDSWTDQLCFLLMLVSEEPEIFGVRLGCAVEGKW